MAKVSVIVDSSSDLEEPLEINKNILVSGDGRRTLARLRLQADKFQFKDGNIFMQFRAVLRTVPTIQKISLKIRTRHDKIRHWRFS